MRMANYGLVIYKDNSFDAIRTNMSPGISDKYKRDAGVRLLVVIPYRWVLLYRQSLTYLPVGKDQEDDMIYDAAMAWIAGKEVRPHAHRRIE